MLDVNRENFIFELKQKNPMAVEFIVREYGSLIKSVMVKFLYDKKETLDECFNDILLAIWNNSDKFDDKKSQFTNWICAIAKYRAIDALRRETRHSERLVSIEGDQDFDWLNHFQSPENDENDESIEELQKLLSCLCEEDRDLFFRRYVAGQSIDEIAEVKNMKRSLLYSRISRGKKKIRNHVECQNGGVLR